MSLRGVNILARIRRSRTQTKCNYTCAGGNGKNFRTRDRSRTKTGVTLETGNTTADIARPPKYMTASTRWTFRAALPSLERSSTAQTRAWVSKMSFIVTDSRRFPLVPERLGRLWFR